MAEEYDYLLCGWRVRSALQLPELPVWAGPGDAPADVTILAGPVPERLPGTLTPSGIVDITEDGTALVHIPDLVRILLRGGREVTVDVLRQEGEASGWRVFLLGMGLSLLCDQRGLFPLHAATLQVGGRTVAIAGDSGAGKSTLALALTRRGHRLLSDDLTVLSTAGPSGVMVLPAYPRLKLWRDTLDWAGMSVEGLPRVRSHMQKYDLSTTTTFAPDATRLDTLLVLEKSENDTPPVLRQASPAEAVLQIMRHASRRRLRFLPNRKQAFFGQSAAIAGATPVFQLVHPWRLDALAATVSLIENMAY